MTAILTPFLAAFIIAYILEPLTKRLTGWGVARSLAALISLLIGLAASVFLVLLFLNLMQHEVPLIKNQFPIWLESSQQWLTPKLERMDITLDWDKLRTQASNRISTQFSDNANTLVTSVINTILASSSSILSAVTHLILIIFIVFYLLLDWNRFFETLKELIPHQYRKTAVQLSLEANDLLSQYLRGEFSVILILAIFYVAGLSLIGINGSLALGIFTGLVVIIPYLGFLLGFTLSLMASFLQFGFGSEFISVLALFGVGQFFEGFFLTPRLVGERIGLHPVAVLFSLLFFGELFGFFGILLALPIAAVCLVGIRFIKSRYTNSEWFRTH